MRYCYLLLSIIFIACEKNTHENYHSFHEKGWHTDSAITFNYIITDTNKTYNFRLKIRHTVDYEFRNLFVFLEDKNKDTVEINLATKSGKWLGKGVSNIREVEYFIAKRRSFSKEGTYSVKIEQAMRYGEKEKIEVLQQILDVGLIVSEQ